MSTPSILSCIEYSPVAFDSTDKTYIACRSGMTSITYHFSQEEKMEFDKKNIDENIIPSLLQKIEKLKSAPYKDKAWEYLGYCGFMHLDFCQEFLKFYPFPKPTETKGIGEPQYISTKECDSIAIHNPEVNNTEMTQEKYKMCRYLMFRIQETILSVYQDVMTDK